MFKNATVSSLLYQRVTLKGGGHGAQIQTPIITILLHIELTSWLLIAYDLCEGSSNE